MFLVAYEQKKAILAKEILDILGIYEWSFIYYKSSYSIIMPFFGIIFFN
jgi:hypothetical protein